MSWGYGDFLLSKDCYFDELSKSNPFPVMFFLVLLFLLPGRGMMKFVTFACSNRLFIHGNMKAFFHDTLRIIFPYTCPACGTPLQRSEDTICLSCILQLPKTNFHLLPENPVLELFYGRFPVTGATAFLYFRKHGIVQKLIHQLKYHGAQEVGRKLGMLFGKDLRDTAFVQDVDFLVPVPLHPKKLALRGFNQAEVLCLGLEKTLGIPLVKDQLARKEFTETQTRKSMYERWENVFNVFEVRDPALFEHKHILLVDDVITTGSTLEACMQSMREIPGIKISVAVLAKPVL